MKIRPHPLIKAIEEIVHETIDSAILDATNNLAIELDLDEIYHRLESLEESVEKLL